MTENLRGSGDENPVNKIEVNEEIRHVAGASSCSSFGEDLDMIVNRCCINGDVEHATVPPIASENRPKLHAAVPSIVSESRPTWSKRRYERVEYNKSGIKPENVITVVVWATLHLIAQIIIFTKKNVNVWVDNKELNYNFYNYIYIN